MREGEGGGGGNNFFTRRMGIAECLCAWNQGMETFVLIKSRQKCLETIFHSLHVSAMHSLFWLNIKRLHNTTQTTRTDSDDNNQRIGKKNAGQRNFHESFGPYKLYGQTISPFMRYREWCGRLG